MGSMPSTYQRTPSIARSTSACASRQGLPISQTRRRASSSRCSVRASRVAATRARRSASGTWRQARCWSSEARTAWWAVAAFRRGGPAMGLPSTGLVAGSARPSARQEASQRLRTRSSWNASGATARQRCQASAQDVPDFRTRGVLRVDAIRMSPLSVHSRGREVPGSCRAAWCTGPDEEWSHPCGGGRWSRPHGGKGPYAGGWSRTYGGRY